MKIINNVCVNSCKLKEMEYECSSYNNFNLNSCKIKMKIAYAFRNGLNKKELESENVIRFESGLTGEPSPSTASTKDKYKVYGNYDKNQAIITITNATKT